MNATLLAKIQKYQLHIHIL